MGGGGIECFSQRAQSPEWHAGCREVIARTAAAENDAPARRQAERLFRERPQRLRQPRAYGVPNDRHVVESCLHVSIVDRLTAAAALVFSGVRRRLRCVAARHQRQSHDTMPVPDVPVPDSECAPRRRINVERNAEGVERPPRPRPVSRLFRPPPNGVARMPRVRRPGSSAMSTPAGQPAGERRSVRAPASAPASPGSMQVAAQN